MRASDLLRDLIEPGTPAKAANAANSSASTAFVGLRTAANGCESTGGNCEIRSHSQAFATPESEMPRGFSQRSQDSQQTCESACAACGCGSLWRDTSGAWWCEKCTPPGNAKVATWRNFSGGKVPQAPPPAEPWPADLDAQLRRIGTCFEWSQADRRDFIAWARRSPEGLADARTFLEHEAAKLPVPGLDDRRRFVLERLAADPALRVAWLCADDGADPVRLVVAVRGAGCCEMSIPRAKFDALALPDLIGQLTKREDAS